MNLYKGPARKVTKTEIILLVLAIIYILPIYTLVVNSFKSYNEILQNPYSLPRRLSFDNYITVLRETAFLEALKNSFICTVIVIAILVLFSSMTAYAIIRRENKYNNLLYLYFIAGVIVPYQAYMIPLIKEFQVMGLLRTPMALILTYVAQYTPLSVFLYTGFIKSVPKEMEEAAVIDGCDPYRTFFEIVFPILKPCTSSVIIFFSVSVWNAFVQPMTIIGTTRFRILTVEIYSFVQDKYFQEWNLTFATCFLALLPISILYLTMQNLIIGGLTSGSVKA